MRLGGLIIAVFVAEFYIRADQKTVLEFLSYLAAARHIYQVGTPMTCSSF